MNIKAIKIDVLIKFIEDRYVDETVNKGIYFNKLEIFKKVDGLTEDQFDFDEGSIIDFKKPSELQVFDKSFKKIGKISGKNIIKSKFKKSFNFAGEIPIACFSRLTYPYDFTFVKIKEGVYEFRVKDKIIRELSNIGGNRPYVFFGERELIRCLNDEIKNGKKILARKINYYKSKGKNITKDEMIRNPYKIIFMKNEIYKNQKEFRIALLDKKDSGYYKVPNLNVEKSESLGKLRLYIKKRKPEQLLVELAEEDEMIFNKFRKED